MIYDGRHGRHGRPHHRLTGFNVLQELMVLFHDAIDLLWIKVARQDAEDGSPSGWV